MKTFETQAAQGDFLITKVEDIPGDAVIANGDKEHVIAHSETGHNHVMAAEHVDFYASANDEFVAYIEVKKPTVIRHLRNFDTHAPLKVKEGKYRINRQREHTPEGYRRAAD